MTIQDLGSIGELVAAVATVLTLIYLAAQIRQNTRALQGTSQDSSVDRMQAWQLALATDPELGDLYRRASIGEDVSDSEVIRLRYLWNYVLLGSEALHYQYLRRNVEPVIWEAQRARLARVVVGTPAFRDYWQGNRAFRLTEPFERLIDELIETST